MPAFEIGLHVVHDVGNVGAGFQFLLGEIVEGLFLRSLDVQLGDAERFVELVADFAGDDVLFSRGGFEPFDQCAAFEIGEDRVKLVGDFFEFGEQIFLLRDRLIDLLIGGGVWICRLAHHRGNRQTEARRRGRLWLCGLCSSFGIELFLRGFGIGDGWRGGRFFGVVVGLGRRGGCRVCAGLAS